MSDLHWLTLKLTPIEKVKLSYLQILECPLPTFNVAFFQPICVLDSIQLVILLSVESSEYGTCICVKWKNAPDNYNQGGHRGTVEFDRLACNTPAWFSLGCIWWSELLAVYNISLWSLSVQNIGKSLRMKCRIMY